MKVIPVMNYATPQVAKAEARQDSPSFGAARPATMAKSHSGRKIGLALAVPALILAAVLGTTSCANPVSGGTKTEETDPTKPADPAKPSQSPVSSALQTLFKVLKVGGSSSGASASLVSKSVYAPVAGDVTAISYHDDYGNDSVSYTLDTSKSTSDALVYNTKGVDDNFGIVTTDVCTVAKTDSGVKYTYASDGSSFEYVVKDGYVMVYKTKNGTTTEFERQYPGDTANTVKITAPDGSTGSIAASTLSDYEVTYSQ